MRHLEEGRVVIFAAGTGNPFFTTDTAAALRGAEIGAEIVLKATKVDGVYSADPKKDPTATRYSTITFDEAIVKNLKVMDATAFALCRDQNLLIKVFSIFKPGALKRVVRWATTKERWSTPDGVGGDETDAPPVETVRSRQERDAWRSQTSRRTPSRRCRSRSRR